MKREVVSATRRDDVAWVDGGERVVVVRLGDLGAPPVILSQSAAEIWRLLADTSDTRELTALVALGYDVPRDLVEGDVLSWLAEAEIRGIVRLK